MTPKYAHNRPARIPYGSAKISAQLRQSSKTFVHLLCHTISFFKTEPTANNSIAEPRRTIDDNMLEVCKHISVEAEERQTTLATKATGLLSLIVIVVPLTASLAVFIRQQDVASWVAHISLILNGLAFLFLLLALFASLRALSIRSHERLFVGAVIDHDDDMVRKYSADFFGRGLLHIAASRHAVCDHIADFVRAAQVFLTVGTVLIAISAAALVPGIEPDTKTIHGSLELEPSTISVLRSHDDKVAIEHDRRLTSIEAELGSLAERVSVADAGVQEKLDGLIEELAEMRARNTDLSAPKQK
jgi:hypothetical protein